MSNSLGTSSETSSPGKQQTLKEFIAANRNRTRRFGGNMDEPMPLVEDPFKNTSDVKGIFKTKTLYGYVPSKEHFSPWDKNYPERPERSIMLHDSLYVFFERLKVMKGDDLIKIEPDELLQLYHTNEHIKNVKALCESSDETFAQQYDSIFFNGIASYYSAIKSMEMTVSMAKLIAEGKYTNGFANVRPPGHHATSNVPNGYCFFNNVVLAAKYLLKENLANKILIVDFDVHHGQGTQRAFFETDEVLYFSIHRYEYGTFWPNLKESNFDYIGVKKGRGYNINVPLNDTGMTDYDYLSIIIYILLPIAYEFQPSIVLVSAGYDACVGCPEGRMEVTPAFYHHLTTMLMGLAQGKILVVLEGGYFIPTLAMAGLKTVEALLGYPAPPLEYHKRIHPLVIDSINDTKAALMEYWKCFMNLEDCTAITNILDYNKYENHVAIRKYIGTIDKPPFPTREIYNKNTEEEFEEYVNKLQNLMIKYEFGKTEIGFFINIESTRHQPPVDTRIQEVEARVTAIKMKLDEYGLLDRMTEIRYERIHGNQSGEAGSLDTWYQVNEVISETHGNAYLDNIKKGIVTSQKSDWYLTKNSFSVCQFSCVMLSQLVLKLHDESISHGVAIVRPPGHHAKANEGSGFCLINNVVVTANYCRKYTKRFKRILILDFDVHHGDGTQELTYDKDDIMYISMHRYDNAKFYPKNNSGDFKNVGKGKAAGYNVNIAFNDGKLSSADYIQTWIRVVLPLAYSFKPDLILVSAGFDAGIYDPLGGYTVAPEIFGHFIQLTKSIAPMMLILEGGYNLETTSLSMVNCVRSLLSHPIPLPKFDDIKDETYSAIKNIITVLKPFWPLLEVNKKIDTAIRTQEELD